jgi:hypothetical protein
MVAGVKHVAVAIDDNNLCTDDACDPVAGITHLPVVIDDMDACTADACSPVSGVVHMAVVVDDNNACTVDTCDKTTGVSHVPAVLDDNDACTTDACDMAFGVSHVPVVCNDSDACTSDSCNTAVGCIYTPVVIDDGNLCTTDSCDSATGVHNTPISCDDASVCTADSCNPQVGCINTPVVYFKETFANNAAGWTLGTNWGIGSATASTGNTYSGPDPAADHSPSADNGVAGVVLGGNLPTTVTAAPVYLTSPAISLVGVTTPTTLEFYRWLNSDYSPYMINYVDIFDGTSWINVFTSGGSPGINDTAWTKVQYNVPATALNKAGVRVRFGYNVAAGAFIVSSWNVDDVRLLPGAVPNSCP